MAGRAAFDAGGTRATPGHAILASQGTAGVWHPLVPCPLGRSDLENPAEAAPHPHLAPHLPAPSARASQVQASSSCSSLCGRESRPGTLELLSLGTKAGSPEFMHHGKAGVQSDELEQERVGPSRVMCEVLVRWSPTLQGPHGLQEIQEQGSEGSRGDLES